MRYLMTAIIAGALCVPPLHAKDKEKQEDAGSKAVKVETREKAKAFFKQQKEKRRAFRKEIQEKRKAFYAQMKQDVEGFLAKNPEIRPLVEKRLRKRHMRRNRRGEGRRKNLDVREGDGQP